MAGKGKSKPGSDRSATPKTQAERTREEQESAKAKNAGATARQRMVDIGRGNQQAGRQHGPKGS